VQEHQPAHAGDRSDNSEYEGQHVGHDDSPGLVARVSLSLVMTLARPHRATVRQRTRNVNHAGQGAWADPLQLESILV
jgi:hypothetical protein